MLLLLLLMTMMMMTMTIAELQGCARDLLSGDRDETETFKILSETRPRRDV